MRPIAKRVEPASLTQHRATPHASYDNYEQKDDLRAGLVAEQGAICCYCMQRIQADGTKMKIEHWQCQEKHEDRALDYDNLLGACLGGHGRPEKLQHCDTRKGALALSRNPAAPAPLVDRDIHYLARGEIRSDSAAFNRELNDVLNLNLARLQHNRKAVLDALREWADGFGRLRKADIRAELREWEEMEDGLLREYAQVAVYWLNKRLEQI